MRIPHVRIQPSALNNALCRERVDELDHIVTVGMRINVCVRNVQKQIALTYQATRR